MQSILINHIISTGDWSKVNVSQNMISVDQESGLETLLTKKLDPKKTGYLRVYLKAEDDKWTLNLVDKENHTTSIEIDFEGEPVTKRIDTLQVFDKRFLILFSPKEALEKASKD